MVFKSDRQRKGFFGSTHRSRSNIRPTILSDKKLQNLAKGFKINGNAFFSKKSNAIKFGKILQKKGFKVLGSKSGAGPTVESEAGIRTGKPGVSFNILIVGKKGKVFRK